MEVSSQQLDAPRSAADCTPAADPNEWTRREATHLLWRAQFGATLDEIDQATEAGLQATLDRLLTPQTESAAFQKSEALLRRGAEGTGDIADWKAWWLYRMLYSANPLVEKMTLFWHNHFATSYAKVRSAGHMAAQNDLLRRHALGNFRDLLHGMARDTAMLAWLDGNANRKRHPNENFAREVFELFSLGVGHYSEQDIQEAARAFTGWHVRQGGFWFNELQHDDGVKHVLGESGRFDGNDIIELCLKQPACAQFLARKLLTAFVAPAPSGEAVNHWAERIRVHDFEMAPVLRELFGSTQFFSRDVHHALIKSPLEFVLGAQRTLGKQVHLAATVRLLAELGQDVFEPPTVKGWEGGRLWINSATLLQRMNFAAEFVAGNRFGKLIDPLDGVGNLHGEQPDALVRFYVDMLLARDLEPATHKRLTEFVRESPGDRSQQARGLIHLLMTLPEYQLM
jgi:uncharacterized protein (DUF1800 family)